MMKPTFDILGLGCVAIDDLLYVDSYPAADTKVQIRRHERQCGGLTGTALVAAARQGSNCAYAGSLGEDELSQFVLDRLAQEGIDVTHVKRVADARPIHSVIIIDDKTRTRTVLYDLENVVGAQADWPPEDMIRAARVLFVDHFGVEGMIRAARIAKQAGTPVVADFESDQGPGFRELLGLVDHLILSQEFAQKLTGESIPVFAAKKLWRGEEHSVVITSGAEGCWFIGRCPWELGMYWPAYSVPVVDTTGCGDVFHGAYAAALARGESEIDVCIRFASAAAALKAKSPGGQSGIASLSEVEAFLKAQPCPYNL